jgi:alkylation response protein AidB-like acyl-CoA dehydrogenase
MADLSDFIARIKATAASRETEHELLFEQIRELQALGFGASRLPSSWGGGGVNLEQLFSELIDLAAADSNLAHAYRGHLAFVESLLLNGITQDSVWVTRILAGDFVGNAQS